MPLPHPDVTAAAAQEQLSQQFTLLQGYAAFAFQSLEQILALQFQFARQSLNDYSQTSHQLLNAKDAQEWVELSKQRSQTRADHLQAHHQALQQFGEQTREQWLQQWQQAGSQWKSQLEQQLVDQGHGLSFHSNTVFNVPASLIPDTLSITVSNPLNTQVQATTTLVPIAEERVTEIDITPAPAVANPATVPGSVSQLSLLTAETNTAAKTAPSPKAAPKKAVTKSVQPATTAAVPSDKPTQQSASASKTTKATSISKTGVSAAAKLTPSPAPQTKPVVAAKAVAPAAKRASAQPATTKPATTKQAVVKPVAPELSAAATPVATTSANAASAQKPAQKFPFPAAKLQAKTAPAAKKARTTKP
ncbi:phasin family protein [Undibacterium curvum]|uniref:Phasin family protein n=1 Tax=Undibacterium curvum TaxID=2762294 RepID=A0ABR7A315_9BURK|nr:phasin family protein [Undibacterium curvum]MBC3931291.1 phasin family protein [Undibacterium curvum]